MTEKRGRNTRLVEGGRRKELTGGIVNPPVWRASTILFDDVAAMRAASPPRDGRLHYGRSGTPTSWALAEALTDLEPGAAGTVLLPSGVAAISITLMAVLSPGDELLMVDSVYGPTRTFCDTVLAQLGVRTIYYDPMLGAEIASILTERTRAVFMESPGSLTFEVQDVPAICAAAQARGIATILDNTWATPLLFRAIERGVDISMLSCTKYVGGHSDVMLGSLTVSQKFWPMVLKTARAFGQHVSPDDAFLAARGLRTMAVRLRQHGEAALTVAHWLAEQPQVARVLHPALPDCPGHALWQRDFEGASGLFSFVLRGGGGAARDALVDALELFGIGYSWGGFESLAIPADPVRTAAPPVLEGPVVRLHIGLEDTEDLITDLERALGGYPSS